MIAYRKEKIDNAICFFALEHKKKSGKDLAQTFLYKYLAFLDFLSVEKTGVPAFDLEYKAMEKGPVPYKIYNKRRNLKTNLYEFIDRGENIYIVKSKAKPSVDYFSGFEINIMNQLISKYATKYSKTGEISDDSHRRIKAWQKAYEGKINSIIDYALTFEGDITKKSEEDLTQAEECFLTFQAMKNAARCKPAR